jgi:hypothetical protein
LWGRVVKYIPCKTKVKLKTFGGSAMLYVDVKFLNEALKDGVNVQAVLNALLYEDNITIYDYDNMRPIYQLYSFDDLIEFMELWLDEQEQEQERLILKYYWKWYYKKDKGITMVYIYMLKDGYKMVMDYGDGVKEKYMKTDRELLNTIKWHNCGRVLYIQLMDYDTPKEIKEYLNSMGSWVKFTI